MTDTQIFTMALLAIGGSLVPSRVPVAAALTLLAVAYVARRPLLLALAVALLCSSLAHRSWSGLNLERNGQLVAVGTMVTDPVRNQTATSAVVRVDGVRYLAAGWGATGARLGRAEAGDSLAIEGSIKPYRGSRERRAALHVGSRLSLSAVEVHPTANPLFAAANQIRNRIAGGASSLSRERRALFTGLVYGDDREQDAGTAANFRLAGLTHLLAVSGQNVAYALTLAGPLIRRCSLRGRWVATLALLLLFATITRFEPSVLRATFMAGLAVTGRWLGRETSTGRLLALTITVLLVIDPLLASTLAFRLSVAASAGIVWLRPLVVRQLRGPASLTDAIGVTVAAQLAVAPILVATFGPVSLVSVPANVVAGPIAGLAMSWGMTAGLGAGFLPPTLAGAVHHLTTVMLWALESVASVAASVPLAPVGAGWLSLAICASTVRARWPRARAARHLYRAAVAVLIIALVPVPAHGRHDAGPNSEVLSHEGTSVLVLRDGSATTWIIDDIRSNGVRRLDAIVSSQAHVAAAAEIGTRLSTGAYVVATEHPQLIDPAGMSLVVQVVDGQLEAERGE